jgi:hypothetical protein
MSLYSVLLSSFTPSVEKQVQEKTQFITSGVITKSDRLSAFLSGGGFIQTLPNNEIFIRSIRFKEWDTAKLEVNSLDELIDKLSSYESRQLSLQILSVMKGAFESTAKDSSIDLSCTKFIPGVTNLSAEHLTGIAKTMPENSVLVVHSAVYNRYRKNNLVDYGLNKITNQSEPVVDGVWMLPNDNLPKNGNVYTSYLCAPGSLEIAFSDLHDATRVVTTESDQETLVRKWQTCIHPTGFAWNGSIAAHGGPTNEEYASADAWVPVPGHQPKMIQIITREA